MSTRREPQRPDRRRAPRQFVGWVGQYVIPSRPDLAWRDCLVLDASETGLALMLFGPWPNDLDTELDVIVRLEPSPDADAMEMLGRVRNSTQVKLGELRVGIELTGRDGGELLALLGSFTASTR